MTIHVLHAGDGYTYLTRQVAAADTTLRRGQQLTDTTSRRGTRPAAGSARDWPSSARRGGCTSTR